MNPIDSFRLGIAVALLDRELRIDLLREARTIAWDQEEIELWLEVTRSIWSGFGRNVDELEPAHQLSPELMEILTEENLCNLS